MGCASGCVKCCLNTINTLWGISSVLILALGAIYIGNGPLAIIVLLFFIGGVGLVASILGCCGTCQEHIGMTIAYAVFIGISLLIQISGMIFGSNLEDMRKYAEEDITKAWNEEVTSPGSMDFQQQAFKCCGKNSPNDYILIHRDYPKSCYPRQFVNQTTLYTTGCIEKAGDAYVDLARGLLNGSWGTVIFTIIMLVLAIYLILRFRRKQRQYNY